MNPVEDFNAYRSRMNERILSSDKLVIKRLFNLDTNGYEAGKVDEATKEMIGLACSMALRCDDYVKYHLGQCKSLKITTSQLFEVFAIANLIGRTIVIPHLRRSGILGCVTNR